MGDDDRDSDDEQFSVEDILFFEEGSLGEYTSEVQDYFEKALKLKVQDLKDLCSTNGVQQSERRQGGPPFPTWTKARRIRDLMAAGVALDSGEVIDPDQVVPNQWKALVPEGADDDAAPEHAEDAVLPQDGEPPEGQAVETPAMPEQVLAMFKHLQGELEATKQRLETQQMEISRLRASKSEPMRECGLGLVSVQLRQESKDLLWPVSMNAFEAKTLTGKQYQDLMRSNSSDELTLHKRPGMSADVAKYASKTEFSLKNIWDVHTKPVVMRLEPMITTLVTAHTHLENALDGAYSLAGRTIEWTSPDGTAHTHTLPAGLQLKARQLEDDLGAAQDRIVATVKLIQSETARLCGDTQAAILKKMSAGASQQLTISKQLEKNQLASMLTPSLIKTMEDQRQQQKALNHALDKKSQPTSNHQGKGGKRRGQPRTKGGQPPKPVRPPAQGARSPKKDTAAPRPAPKGKDGGKGGK